MPEVTILPDGLQVTAAEAETVLAALSRAGLRYRVGCRWCAADGSDGRSLRGG